MTIALDRHNATSLYEQIAAKLRAEIDAGAFEPSGRLPSEAELTKRFDVSRVTVRLALDVLVHDGAVERRQGKGTYVAGRRLRHELNTLLSFHEALAAQGVDARIETLSCERGTLPPKLALGGSRRREGLVLRRLHLAGTEPVALATSYLPLSLQAVDWRGSAPRPVYAVLESELGITVQRADLTIRASAADATVAALLRLPEGAPLLEMVRDSFDQDGHCTDHAIFQIRPERYEFSLSSMSRVRLGDRAT